MSDLPDDIDALRALVLEQSRILAEDRAASEARLTELGVAKGEPDAEIERLQSIIDAFRGPVSRFRGLLQETALNPFRKIRTS